MHTQAAILKWLRQILRKKILMIFLIAIVFYATGKMFYGTRSDAVDNKPNKLVEVEKVKQQDLQQTVNLLGTIKPKHVTTLLAKGNGMLDTLIPTGQKVKKGTLIAEMKNPELENSVQLSQNAEALARVQYERLNTLISKGYVSAKEAEEKKQIWIEAQKELSKAKIELDNLRFYAPFNGIIGAYKKREGTQINNGEAVVTLYDPSSLVVDVDIPCSNLRTVNAGQAVKILGKTYALNHFQKMLDEETHMCPADIDFQCENCLMGSTIPIELVVAEKKNTIVVPFQALFLKNGQPFVYLVKKGKIVLVAVKTGLQQKDKIEILTGLKPGQQLVIKGQERLYPDMPVDIYQSATARTVG
ncbi:efflux RND transporter periplasmic adaptor subunit [Legionella israelensis]|uniref:Efflux RND transporter periplasmic adaptor subunit n=1 Tax=Legionella israelensis TaxID=454 RepID=A0AAX1ED87_9GAMM|nr:efflux RND transporter periplasmic adaptor subunit [Legionella israelensis]QBR83050.1 efflux RND transporter periplasmic adaptor subunit [Legionella israelensis]